MDENCSLNDLGINLWIKYSKFWSRNSLGPRLEVLEHVTLFKQGLGPCTCSTNRLSAVSRVPLAPHWADVYREIGAAAAFFSQERTETCVDTDRQFAD